MKGTLHFNELTHVDLFSGIGGFALAAYWAGLETVLFCEKEPYCQKVLQRHWPDVPIVDDIRELTYERYVADTDRRRELQQQGVQSNGGGRIVHGGQARPFLLTGGFPCQPFSHAGNRGGTEDDRYLWPEMLRVITELSPEWVIGENVAGLLSMDDGAVMEQILADLDGRGYRSEVYLIPAAAVGAPHRRNRVWIVGNRTGKRLEGATGQELQRGVRGFAESDDVGHTDESRPQGYRQSGERTGEQTARQGGRRLPQSRLGREPDELSNWLDRGLNGTPEKARTKEVLQALWSRFGEEAIQRTTRRLWGISAAEVLQPGVFVTGTTQNRTDPGGTSEAVSKISGPALRTVQDEREPSGSPHRQQSAQQQPGKSDDPLWLLSYEVALGEWQDDSTQIAEGYADMICSYWPAALGAPQHKWEPPRVTTVRENRANRLKALGNAIVPPVAYEIIAAIVE